jgi:hypothetical protein
VPKVATIARHCNHRQVKDERSELSDGPPLHAAYVDGSLLARRFAVVDQIASVHMSAPPVHSHMNAGQDGFRDTSSKQKRDLMIGPQWLSECLAPWLD